MRFVTSITGCLQVLTKTSRLHTKLLFTVDILRLRLRFHDIVTFVQCPWNDSFLLNDTEMIDYFTLNYTKTSQLTSRLLRYRRVWTTNRASRLISCGSTIVSRRIIPFASKHYSNNWTRSTHNDSLNSNKLSCKSTLIVSCLQPQLILLISIIFSPCSHSAPYTRGVQKVHNLT